MSDLKPCPFCGSKRVEIRRFWFHPDDLLKHCVYCPDCDSPSCDSDTAEEAASKWNRRVLHDHN